MSSPLPDLLPNISRVTYGAAGIAAVIMVVVKLAHPSKLDAFPTVGSSWLGSWWAALKNMTNAVDVIQEGYEKHKSAPFKVATPYYWMVILSSREHVEEVRKAPEDILSFSDAINDHLQLEYTVAPTIHHNAYHSSIIRSQLTRNIGALYPEIRNEVITAFDDILDLKGNEWKSVPALRTVQEVICRTTNRVIVGHPLYRDPDWIDLNIRYTIDIVMGGHIIGLFPKVLKPIATWLFTSVNRRKQLGRKLLGPIIEERRKYLNEYGNQWADKPNDFLSWVMEEGRELTIEALTARILIVNFAAIHVGLDVISYTYDAEIIPFAARQLPVASSTHALLYLAANPQYIQPLREEVEVVIEKEGWSKASLSKMHKVDSFLKECQRMEGLNILSVTRKALKGFRFSDGTFLPKGTMIGVAIRCLHYDEKLYKNADVFQPFRFAEMSGKDGEVGKYQFVSTSVEYLPFGHGTQACPGRFFAANEMKTMLAHIVTTYDVKLEDGTTRPPSLRLVTSTMPDPRAKVLFRRRAD